MTKTTPPPLKNVLDILPELANQTVTTIRLHPRQGTVNDPSASKIGGQFLWSHDEKWPTCVPRHPAWWYDPGDEDLWRPDFSEGAEIELIPVLQINARDVPDFWFPPNKDLMQVLWCPLVETGIHLNAPNPMVKWQNSQQITNPLSQMPHSPVANPMYIPKPCTITFERVMEYPDYNRLSDEQKARIEQWDVRDVLGDKDTRPDTLYMWDLSVCPGTKLGGEVFWLQYPEIPICKCGREMTHLLTLAGMEVDGGTYRRWVPVEDRGIWDDPYQHRTIDDAPDWSLFDGKLYIFICRACDDYPTQAVYQR